MSFATINGQPTLQLEEDLPLWTRMLDRYKPKLLLELGTWNGAFSGWLYEQTLMRDCRFASFDIKKPICFSAPWFRQTDVLTQTDKVLSEFEHPMILWCDNGNKPREVELYAPHLKAGDLLAVHDWGTEIHAKDIPPGFKLLEATTMTAVFEKE
jgi:cephalosporin hydroxylase